MISKMSPNAVMARFVLGALALKARVFEENTKDPMKCQQKALFEYLSRNKDTEYGRKYKFSEIRSVSDYQSMVPMSDYASLKPYVERMKNGEKKVLVSDDVIFFGLTSGTTSRQKFIPVTEYSKRIKGEVANIWSYYIAKDHPNILDGKILAIISPDTEGYASSGVRFGAESGHGYKSLPAAIKRLYALPYEVFEINDYDSRYYSILRLSMDKDVTTIATLSPTMLVMLCQKIEGSQQDIIKDIETGALKKDLNIEPGARTAIEKTIKPNPKRADELRSIIARHGALLPKYFWPNLQIIECWKAGTVKLYLKELPQYFGGVPIRDFGCLSTEARSSIPMSDDGAGGVLAISTNFYEFVPKEDMGKADMRFFTCDRLETGREYFLIVTTPGGLYRYNIDDIVRVNGFFNKTPVIEFVQKGLSAFSMTGEKLYESQVNEAVNKASDTLKLLIRFFSATVQRDTPPRYIFLAEFDGSPDRKQKRLLLGAIERELYNVNQEYEYVRNAGLLASPILKVVKHGSFERYKARRLSQGAHDGQFKVPELVPDPEFQKNFEIEEEIWID